MCGKNGIEIPRLVDSRCLFPGQFLALLVVLQTQGQQLVVGKGQTTKETLQLEEVGIPVQSVNLHKSVGR